MIVDLPDDLEAALKVQAKARGVSPEGYLYEVLERALGSVSPAQPSQKPFKTGRGTLAKYGQAPCGNEIDENRAGMFMSQ